MARLDKIHIRRRKAHRAPFEPAFQQKRASRIRGAGVHVLQLILETLELLFAQPVGAACASEHQRAGWPRSIVDQRVVPGAAGIVDVDGKGRGLHRRKPVPIVGGVKQFQMQDGGRPAQRVALETPRVRTDAMLPPNRPTIRARHNAHAVRPQCVEFARLAIAKGRHLKICVSGDLQVAEERLHQLNAGLFGVWPRQ